MAVPVCNVLFLQSFILFLVEFFQLVGFMKCNDYSVFNTFRLLLKMRPCVSMRFICLNKGDIKKIKQLL